MYFWLEKVPVGKVGDCYLPVLDDGQDESLRTLAAEAARKRFGNGIFIRGLVEISSWCRNNCYYCGLRRSNRFASRYRLSQEQILDCCREGHGSASGLLSCRAEKTGNKMRIGLKNWWAGSVRSSPDMPSRCLWGSATERRTAGGVMQGRTVTCFATKHGMRRIMPFCIRARWTVHGVGSACGR